MRDYLECRAFVEHLRREHKQIHEAVVAVHHELRSTDPPCELDRMRKLLTQLRESLVEHFEEEEQGGCLEEAACFDPCVSTEVRDLEKEHESILKLTEQLLERTNECQTEGFRESFRQFAKVLHTHEAAENRILHTAFGTGVFEADEPLYQ